MIVWPREWPPFWHLPTRQVRQFHEAVHISLPSEDQLTVVVRTSEVVHIGETGMPSDEPPQGVGSDLLWRVAVRLHRDHGLVRPGESNESRRICGRCGQLWPCSGRRLAELALRTAAG